MNQTKIESYLSKGFWKFGDYKNCQVYLPPRKIENHKLYLDLFLGLMSFYDLNPVFGRYGLFGLKSNLKMYLEYSLLSRKENSSMLLVLDVLENAEEEFLASDMFKIDGISTEGKNTWNSVTLDGCGRNNILHFWVDSDGHLGVDGYLNFLYLDF